MILEPDQALVDEMKKEATKLQIMAKVAAESYRSAALILMKERFKKKIGWILSKRYPAECTLPFSGGSVVALIFGVSVDWIGDIKVDYLTKLSSGKWSKTQSCCDAEWVLGAMRSVNPGKSMMEKSK